MKLRRIEPINELCLQRNPDTALSTIPTSLFYSVSGWWRDTEGRLGDPGPIVWLIWRVVSCRSSNREFLGDAAGVQDANDEVSCDPPNLEGFWKADETSWKWKTSGGRGISTGMLRSWKAAACCGWTLCFVPFRTQESSWPTEGGALWFKSGRETVTSRNEGNYRGLPGSVHLHCLWAPTTPLWACVTTPRGRSRSSDIFLSRSEGQVHVEGAPTRSMFASCWVLSEGYGHGGHVSPAYAPMPDLTWSVRKPKKLHRKIRSFCELSVKFFGASA